MPKLESLDLVWLTGCSCDGCTIRALGDTSDGAIEALLTGRVAGLPRIRLVHTALSFEAGEAFVEQLRRAERGEPGGFGLIVEAAIPDDALAGSGFFSVLGEENGRPVTMAQWLRRLAPKAAFVIAWGDCAVWGGPHSLVPNPIGSTGVLEHLGLDFRSTLGLPVVNLPGCAPPSVFIATLTAVIRWIQGEGPPPELDDLNRPKQPYEKVWKGAFAAWQS